MEGANDTRPTHAIRALLKANRPYFLRHSPQKKMDIIPGFRR